MIKCLNYSYLTDNIRLLIIMMPYVFQDFTSQLNEMMLHTIKTCTKY